MKYYAAPMEGVNVAMYREAQHEYFGGIDKHFSPFLVPNDGVKFKQRQLVDILPENNANINLVPQVLTNKADDFIRVAKEIQDLGYEVINLNLGCPSGTVVAKNKGSGFLSVPEELDEFLYKVFEACDVKISIKSRLGKDSKDEFYRILEIYNKYQLDELIIHPRIQKDFYKNKPHLDFLDSVINESKNKIGYNGDIFTLSQCAEIEKRFPEIDSIMLGRGLVCNPALAREISTGEGLGNDELRKFHDYLYHENLERQCGNTNVLYRMKEYWYYMNHTFPDSKKYWKKIKKATKLEVYDEVVNDLFTSKKAGQYFDPYTIR